jgi:hypothetical protein
MEEYQVGCWLSTKFERATDFAIVRKGSLCHGCSFEILVAVPNYQSHISLLEI